MILSNKFLVCLPRERDHAFLPTQCDHWQYSDARCFENMRVTATGTGTSHRWFSSQLLVTDTHCSILWW